jgi:hypothetical protein
MLDKRGQAFSVFELLIAAIVAIAILGVLLPLITGGWGGFSNNAASEIGNSLSTVEGGGSVTSQAFVIKKGEYITSKDWADKGFDQKSIVIMVSSRLNSMDKFVDLAGADFSGFEYTGNTDVEAKAKVTCQQTGQDLEDVVGSSTWYSDGTMSNSIDGLCGYDGEVSPCCIIYLDKK